MQKYKQAGFTLIEVLIAMIISLVLIFACASIYTSLQASIQLSQGLSTAQESLTTAHTLIGRSVKQSDALTWDSTNKKLFVSYGVAVEEKDYYNCLGLKISAAGATDVFFVQSGANSTSHLHCQVKLNAAGAYGLPKIIALNVKSLSAALPSNAYNPNQRGVEITLRIIGMPEPMATKGFTFSLAMRQRILSEADIPGGSSGNAGLTTN